MNANTVCSHLGTITDAPPSDLAGCHDCLLLGTRWVHLRMCRACGHIGCCDQSPGRHATAHFHATTHPIIRSYEPGETWFWCYPDAVMFELNVPPGPSHP